MKAPKWFKKAKAKNINVDAIDKIIEDAVKNLHKEMTTGSYQYAPYVDFSNFEPWKSRYVDADIYRMMRDREIHMNDFFYISADDDYDHEESFDPIRPYNWDEIWEELSTPMKMKCFKFFYELDNAQIIRL